MDAQTIITSVLCSLIVGIGSSWLTFRLQFERFRSMDKEREKHWEIWRNQISADVEMLKKSAGMTEVALLKQSLDSLAKRADEIWKYTTELKHLVVDPYVKETSLISQRVAVLERRYESKP